MDNKTRKNISDSGAAGIRADLVMSDLKFAQINLHRSIKATATFCRGLRMEQTDVCLLQEPLVRDNVINGFGVLKNRLFYHRTGGRPRAAIYVSPNVNAMILNQFSDEDLVAVRVCRKDSEGGDFIVASVYMPYDSQLQP